MKKLSIYLISVFVLGLTACDDTSDLGKMQINEELPAIPADCVKIQPGTAMGETSWDLGALPSDEGMQLVKTTETKDLPANSTVTYGAEFSASEDFTNPAKIEVPGNGILTVTEIDNIFRSIFGMGPKPHTMYCRYKAYVNDGTQKLAVGAGNAVWQVSKAIEVTPIPKPMEERYYLVGDPTNWDLGKETAVEMSHMTGVDIYDNPYFWIVLTTTKEDNYWKIAPQSAQDSSDWNALLGAPADGTEATAGTLVDNPEKGPGAFILKGIGRWLLRFNAMERTFTIAPANDALWTPGAGLNNWDPGTSFPLPTVDGQNYDGYSYLGNEYKLTVQPDWKGPSDYSQGFENGWIAWNGKNGNIVPSIMDFVHVSVNTGSWQISYAKINGFGLIGNFNEWKLDKVVSMTHNENWQVWTADVTVVADAGNNYVFKFITSNGQGKYEWDYNLGNYKDSNDVVHENHLVQNGDNVNFPGPGTYTVTLNLSTVPYSYKITAK